MVVLNQLEKLYKNHFEELYRYSFTILMNNQIAEDVVQDCFIEFFKELQKDKMIDNPRAYLFKMVYHRSLAEAKKQAKIILQDEDESFKTIPIKSKLDALIQEEDDKDKWKLLDQILEKMPEQCRKVFLKSKYEQKKYRQIAEELDLSEKTVEAHMSKALKIIRDYVRVNGHSFTLILAMIGYE